MIQIAKGYYLLNNSGEVQGIRGMLKKCGGGDSYYYYLLQVRGKQRKTYVHRLIGLYYMAKPEGWTVKWTINHIDGNKANSIPSNLEWVTKGRNNIHAHETGLRPRTANKLSDTKALEIYNYYHNNKVNYIEVGSLFKVGRQMVSQIANKISYKHIH